MKMNTGTRITRRLQILGRVQGVGFRYYMQRTAQQLGVAGWVRNRRDGSVEAMVHGSPESVAAIIDWAKRGPSGAAVSEVRIAADEGEYAGFVALPTE
jgi:acylphosphatase